MDSGDYMEEDIIVEDNDSGDSEYSDDDTKIPNDSAQGFYQHNSAIFSLSIRPNKNQRQCIISGGEDDRSYLWDMHSGELLDDKLPSHSDSVISTAWSHDGEYVASAGMDGIIHVSKVTADGKSQLVVTLDGPTKEIEWMCWHPTAYFILAGCADGTIWLWQCKPYYKCIRVFGMTGFRCTCGCFTIDGRLVVGGYDSGVACIWSPQTGDIIHRFSCHLFGGMTCMALHRDRPILLTGSEDKQATLANMQSGKILCLLQGHTDVIESVDFCTNQFHCVSGSLDHSAKIWDLNYNQLRDSCNHNEGITRVKYHNTNPSLLVTGLLDGNLALWDSRGPSLLSVLHGHSSSILDFKISECGQYIVSASEDNSCLVFDLRTLNIPITSL